MKDRIWWVGFALELVVNGTFVALSLAGPLPLPFKEQAISLGALVAPFVLVLSALASWFAVKDLDHFLRKHALSILLTLACLISIGDPQLVLGFSGAHLLTSLFSLYHPGKWEWWKTLARFLPLKSPAQIVTLSFSGIILLGTFLLMLPLSSSTGESFSLIDALFMATSATCVTGLTTLSLAKDFSLFGQIVILVLVQIGGLSIMTLYSSMAILIGRSMGVKERHVLQNLLDVSSFEELLATIGRVIQYTFIIESLGALVLAWGFYDGQEMGILPSLYYGVFHSVSAFCNAGLTLFENSLENYGTNLPVSGGVMALIFLGGLGFIVLKDIKEALKGPRPRRFDQLGLHSKVVLIVSFILVVLGATFIFFSEYLNALDGYSFLQKIHLSLFQSVTLRTAGFSTLSIENFHSYTLVMMTLFMFIGASPGSTGGGIKTTGLALLVQSIISTLRGRKDVIILDRTMPEFIVVKTMAMAFISLIIVSILILFLLKFAPEHSFLAIFFEVISATATVGLSLGITEELSLMGKAIVSFAMFIGRIGPLTFVLAIGQRPGSSGEFQYPEGRVLVG